MDNTFAYPLKFDELLQLVIIPHFYNELKFHIFFRDCKYCC